MRIKITTETPLVPLKAWYNVSATSSVAALKKSLCSDIPALTSVTPDTIKLLLDDFELLDTSSVDVLREGDLINIATVPATTSKRKVDTESSSPPRKRTKHAEADVVNVPPKGSFKHKTSKVTESSSSETSSDEDETSDSDDSSDVSSDSSESENESDSDQSESSSDDSPPPVESSKVKAKQAPSVTRLTQPPPPSNSKSQADPNPDRPKLHIPPGQGKVSTQNRNLRRKKKKLYEQLAAQSVPDNVNEIPLGIKSSGLSLVTPELVAPTSTQTAPAFMMASLSNKNKRKGFKQMMSSTIPKKIIFSRESEASVEEAPLPFTSAEPVEITAAPNLYPRLIPPSEKQENGQLPRNIFVTSVDVEEGMHLTRKKKKVQDRRANSSLVEEMQVEEVVLSYGEQEDMIPTQRDSVTIVPSISHKYSEQGIMFADDWSNVEKSWDLLPRVTNQAHLSQGSLVAWKALGINPRTFTPEILLNIGRVNDCSNKLTLKPLHRPASAAVAFGGYADEEEVEELDEEVYAWEDVFAGDWRVV